MTTIHELLREYEHLSPNTSAKGQLFERLIQNFLLTDPTYAALYDEVWLWQDWPGRAGKADTGIDLVARSRFGGGLCAIQCKFFSPNHHLQKSDIDSFFTASGKSGFASRMIVSTTDKWSKHAEDALDDQQIPTIRLGVSDLENSGIDWSKYSLLNPESITLKERKHLRPHQNAALGDVVDGFDTAQRGKLIMACGTGKTFTSLRIAEAIVPAGGSVLFLVPSIALLSQSLREWSEQSTRPIRAFAICSDSKVGRSLEDYTVSDLSFPATTDAEGLVSAASAPYADGLTVYFSTYQSIQVVSQAQDAGIPEFDLVVCDEAHRTTGVSLSGEESNFVKVHDGEFIRASRRLYMTATPKIYGESARAQAKEKDASVAIASMDDVDQFGPEFHRLGFGKAVEDGLLSDYRVLVLAVSQDAVSAEFQQQFAQNGSELNLDDAARIAGIYKALSKSGVEGLGEWPSDQAPMRRAVAFSRSIKDSQLVSRLLDGNASIPVNMAAGDDPLVLQSQHVDGTMNVLERSSKLEWLKADAEGNNTRILTNARCLSEGVDVPSLDAVIFLNSRDSQIDVVQSVGRVMRKAPGKGYGYIILPIAVPAGVEPEKALGDNLKYKVVWDVLRALRAHDERFEAKIEQINFNKGKTDDQIQVIGVKDFGPPGEGVGEQSKLDFTPLGDEWRDAVYAKIVQKVGEREYWENWASSVADVAAAQTLRIQALVDTSADVRAEFDRFVKGLQANLNPSVSEQDALEMLAQHLITQPVLEALFEGFSFAANNAVSKAMSGMLSVLEGSNLESETAELEGFYESVRKRVRDIKDPAGKQEFLKLLYQRFFAVAMKKASERLGIVYTPTEIVDFILRSVDHVLREEFDSSIGAEGVNILDPFTGTGTFIAQLIQSDLISDADLPRKFRKELFANEINLLAYYVAAVNIEEAYHSRMGGEYVAFDNILLTDTFQMTEEGDELDAAGVFDENNAGVIRQMATPISVIIGNPPYSAGQSSANDNNQNLKYKTLDKRIEQTYAKLSTAQNKNSLYDSYIRAIRWASDRVGDEGIVAFVSNGGFIDGNTADGLRKSLASEFDSLYIFNLRGNARTSGEQRRREKDNVFGGGSRTSIAISVLVKKAAKGAVSSVFYRDIGDYLSTPEKLAQIAQYDNVERIPWTVVPANDHGDWSNQRNDEYMSFTPLSQKATQEGVFTTHSRGLETSRDAWMYSSSRADLNTNVAAFVSGFNEQILQWQEAGRPLPFEDHLDVDPRKISWSRSLRRSFSKEQFARLDSGTIRTSLYRPFNKQNVYFDAQLNHERSQMPLFFPAEASTNLAIVLTSAASHYPFSCIATNALPDLHTLDTGQVFPLYAYPSETTSPTLFDSGPERVANVAETTLAEYRGAYDPRPTADDIFYYVYGILHSPEYRSRFAADLKKMLPRIPKVKAFAEYAAAGRALADLHVNYETVAHYPLEEMATGEDLLVKKMRFAGSRPSVDRSRIIYNDDITLAGIPPEAHEYVLGSRSALEWIIERYQVKADKASGIVNDANDWGLEHGNPRYIIDLIKSIVTVSVETVEIVKNLPPLEIIE